MKSKVLLEVIVISGLVICFWNIPAFGQPFTPPGVDAPGNLHLPVGGGDGDGERATPQLGQGQQRHVDAQPEAGRALVARTVHVVLDYLDWDGDGVIDEDRITTTGTQTIRGENGETITVDINQIQRNIYGDLPYGGNLYRVTITIDRGGNDVTFQGVLHTYDNSGDERGMDIAIYNQDNPQESYLITRHAVTYEDDTNPDAPHRLRSYDETTRQLNGLEEFENILREWLPPEIPVFI